MLPGNKLLFDWICNGLAYCSISADAYSYAYCLKLETWESVLIFVFWISVAFQVDRKVDQFQAIVVWLTIIVIVTHSNVLSAL